MSRHRQLNWYSQHDGPRKGKKGVLLVNFGSPDSPSPDDVRKFTCERLMDRHVTDAVYPIRYGMAHGCILPFKPKLSAEDYNKAWLPEGSPLIVISKRVQKSIQQRVPVPVELAMRYQHPSIESALQNLIDQKVENLVLISLFPHYSMFTYETAVDRVKELLNRMAPEMCLTVVPPYYDHPDYIGALVASAAEFLKQDYDHLLFSFHGVPQRLLCKSDVTGCHCLKVKNCCEVASPAHATCYRAQCLKTVKAFATKAEVLQRECSAAFKSRLARDPWMHPYTHKEISRLAGNGVKRLLVICPSFVTDCVETLEEIGIRGQETFLAAGGEKFQMIPCLNEHPLWLAFLEKLICEFAAENSEGVFAESMANAH